MTVLFDHWSYDEIVFYVFMLILILFLLGLIFLSLPLVYPLTRFIQWIFSMFCSPGIRSYTRLTLRNNRVRILDIQKSLVFGYALILFIDSIALSQTSMLHINMKYYYGSSFSLYPEENNMISVNELLKQMKSDPVTSSLTAGWISNPLTDSSGSYPTLHSQGHVYSTPIRLWGLVYRIRCRMAVSEDLLSSVFSVWIKEGQRGELAKHSKGLKSTIQEMNSLPIQSSHLVTIIPTNLHDIFHTNTYVLDFNHTFTNIFPYTSLRWL